jgi:ribosome biogenesis GTPase
LGDGRGGHTTTYRDLLPLPQGGAVIDTPGMRELQLWADQDSLDSASAESAALAAECRYRDCRHLVEEGCAVRAAKGAGEAAGRAIASCAAKSRGTRARPTCT